MKAFQQFLATLRQLGVNIPARWVVAQIKAAGAAPDRGLSSIYPRWTGMAREAERPEAPDLDRGTSLPAPVAARVVPARRAWNRFLRGLPPVYRRSILNFDQFVVLGAEGSGKTRIVDAYTDWKRQTKQFVGTHAYDPELQVYLGSNAVVTEIPAAVLHDTSEKCRTALTHLWRPLYRRRSVVVVVALDPIRLGKETPDAIDDLAETVRGKINLLSRIRRGPVEIRVALTHLAQIEGHREYAAFCRDQAISTRIPTRLRGDDAKIGAQLAQWLDAARGHLPRALTTVSAADYKRAVLFLRKAPEIVSPVARFLECLFAHEALSPDPICGGVYLTSETAGPTNPFASSIASVAAPDPRRNHPHRGRRRRRVDRRLPGYGLQAAVEPLVARGPRDRRVPPVDVRDRGGGPAARGDLRLHVPQHDVDADAPQLLPPRRGKHAEPDVRGDPRGASWSPA